MLFRIKDDSNWLVLISFMVLFVIRTFFSYDIKRAQEGSSTSQHQFYPNDVNMDIAF